MHSCLATGIPGDLGGNAGLSVKMPSAEQKGPVSLKYFKPARALPPPMNQEASFVNAPLPATLSLTITLQITYLKKESLNLFRLFMTFIHASQYVTTSQFLKGSPFFITIEHVTV